MSDTPESLRRLRDIQYAMATSVVDGEIRVRVVCDDLDSRDSIVSLAQDAIASLPCVLAALERAEQLNKITLGGCATDEFNDMHKRIERLEAEVTRYEGIDKSQREMIERLEAALSMVKASDDNLRRILEIVQDDEAARDDWKRKYDNLRAALDEK